MHITVNNKLYNIDDNCNLIEVLEKVQIQNRLGVAIAVNNVVIPKIEWGKHIINDKDTILIINAIFGG
jgi:sulfur carrier protein